MSLHKPWCCGQFNSSVPSLQSTVPSHSCDFNIHLSWSHKNSFSAHWSSSSSNMFPMNIYKKKNGRRKHMKITLKCVLSNEARPSVLKFDWIILWMPKLKLKTIYKSITHANNEENTKPSGQLNLFRKMLVKWRYRFKRKHIC